MEETETIRLIVQDDGPGMSEERLDAVRSFTAKPKGHGIGLKNIRERLEMAFGEACSFRIDSVLNQGTTVQIVIPKKREAELSG